MTSPTRLPAGDSGSGLVTDFAMLARGPTVRYHNHSSPSLLVQVEGWPYMECFILSELQKHRSLQIRIFPLICSGCFFYGCLRLETS